MIIKDNKLQTLMIIKDNQHTETSPLQNLKTEFQIPEINSVTFCP